MAITHDLSRRLDLSARVAMMRRCIETSLVALAEGRSYDTQEELTEVVRWLDAEETRDQAMSMGIACKAGDHIEMVLGANGQLVEAVRVSFHDLENV